MNEQDFIDMIWQKGSELYRAMPWRDDTNAYYVLVSELMLQQTQVDRVIPKFNNFILQFPSIEFLAHAPLADVLTAWSGLGYNRRAKYLHESVKIILADYGGTVPQALEDLVKLPGIGPNTAAAIVAYSFNQPGPFIETNIRTVFLHHFFKNKDGVHDSEIRKLVIDTMNNENPRQWYWALMDYGSYLKRTGTSLISKSKHYKKQPPLSGSLRETRGAILRHLTVNSFSSKQLQHIVNQPDRFDSALSSLMADGLVSKTNTTIHLTK